jgi:uncharacterized glyoxalase superfamily protein PhnB
METERIKGIMAELQYSDPRAALEWLAKAFGCSTRLLVADDAGQLVYAESGWGECLFAVVPSQPGQPTSPLASNGASRLCLRVSLNDGIDDHCSVARAAGAGIVQEPMLHFFGDRTYAATDLEGHLWKFSQRIPGAVVPAPDDWTVNH